VGQAFIAGLTDVMKLMSGSFLIGILVAATTTIQGLFVYLFIERLQLRHARVLDVIDRDAINYARQHVLPSFNSVSNDPIQVKSILEGTVEQLVSGLKAVVEQLNTYMADTVGAAAGEGRKMIREALEKALGEHLLDPTRAIMVELREHLNATRQGLVETAKQMHITSEQLAESVRAHYEAPDRVVAAVRGAAVSFQEAACVFSGNAERLDRSSVQLSENLREGARRVEEVALAVGNRAELSALAKELRAQVADLDKASVAMIQTTNHIIHDALQRQDLPPQPFNSEITDLGRKAARRTADKR
jgi:hypothetical protein